VLLAQNDFATFLKSKESAKAELLEKLTGTDIIRAFPKRFTSVASWRKRLTNG
jgi:DNA repair exonuclease SbcCD ATPase subunit